METGQASTATGVGISDEQLRTNERAEGTADKKAEGVVSSLADLCKGSEHRCDRIQRFNGLIDFQVLYHLLARAWCCALL